MNFRKCLAERRVWAIWLVAAALLVKIIIPSGFMPVADHGFFVLEICSGFGPERSDKAMPGMVHDMKRSGKVSLPCGFDGHTPPSVTMADPVLLKLALAFILAMVARMPSERPKDCAFFLRPPLRGPPSAPRIV